VVLHVTFYVSHCTSHLVHLTLLMSRRHRASQISSRRCPQMRPCRFPLFAAHQDNRPFTNTNVTNPFALLHQTSVSCENVLHNTTCWNINHLMLHESVASHFSPTQPLLAEKVPACVRLCPIRSLSRLLASSPCCSRLLGSRVSGRDESR
jgi:hypothetical protein